MLVTVTAVGPQKQSQYGPYFGIKVGDQWMNVQGEQQDLKGKTLEVDVKDSGKFKWAKIKSTPTPRPEAKPPSHNGALAWDDYYEMAKRGHALACELEPDETGTESHFENRSQARAAIVNTILIAFSNGKIALPKEVIPLPDEDDIPPF